MVTVPALRYGAKVMEPEPRNDSLAEVAAILAHGGQSVIVELEPGDGTYYNLLLVPAWAAYVQPHLGRYGIQPAEAHRFLIVTKLTDQEGSAFYATRDVGEWDLHGIENEWSRTLLVWWLRILWQHIGEARGS